MEKAATALMAKDLPEFRLNIYTHDRIGGAPTHEYVDVVSGSGKKTRPKFERMMLAASLKQFDLLLFWKLDRLSREGVRKTLVHLTRLDSYGVAWRSFMEPFFDSCGVMRDVVISIMATLAEQERISISERTKAGLVRAVKAGRTLGRRPVAVDVEVCGLVASLPRFAALITLNNSA